MRMASMAGPIAIVLYVLIYRLQPTCGGALALGHTCLVIPEKGAHSNAASQQRANH